MGNPYDARSGGLYGMGFAGASPALGHEEYNRIAQAQMRGMAGGYPSCKGSTPIRPPEPDKRLLLLPRL